MNGRTTGKVRSAVRERTHDQFSAGNDNIRFFRAKILDVHETGASLFDRTRTGYRIYRRRAAGDDGNAGRAAIERKRPDRTRQGSGIDDLHVHQPEIPRKE